jgi:putative proteasome-type protease
MTYCVALKTKDGLIALADGRITAGTQMTSARKVSLFGEGKNRFFVMTSGLRSIRDKVFAYLQQEMAEQHTAYPNMLETVGAYTRHLRRAELEDRGYIEKSGIAFNLHTVVGGMMEGDSEPRLFLVYPEGNWIEVEHMTPYVNIGSISFGKPILDRALRYDTDMKTAIKIAYLSFDSTKFSSSDVGFPIDMITMHSADRSWREVHLRNEDVRQLRHWWNENLTRLVAETPDLPWIGNLLDNK